MKTFECTIVDPLGFHARPVVLVMSEAAKWECDITIALKRSGEPEVSSLPVPARDPIALMGLEANAGDTLVVTLDGEDECEAEQGMRLACSF